MLKNLSGTHREDWSRAPQMHKSGFGGVPEMRWN